MTYLYIGIDGEMSSSELQEGGKLIQIGLTVRTATGLDTLTLLINPEDPDMQWSAEAAAVHNIPLEKVLLQGRSNDQVDELCYHWLISRGADPRKRKLTIPVGFNIIGFDMPFIKAQLPKTYSLFSRRMADLNGMIWMLQGKDGHGFTGWKDQALEYAHNLLDDHNPHDAGWDSARHLLCFEFFKKLVG